jgi:acyl-CoA synthetase (AMP-forming)/AMP-acid ligase II
MVDPATGKVVPIGQPGELCTRGYSVMLGYWNNKEIRAFCQGQIAHYKIPRYVKFVDSFPMTVTGKIQKFLMRQQSIEELGLAQAASIETA